MGVPARSRYHVSLILTLTINPAVDRTVIVDKLVFEDRGYIDARSEAAGGRGVNASHVLHSFGARTVALLTAGGEAGAKIEQSLAGMGFPFETVRVKADSRTNLTISDRQGLTIKLNEVGAPLEKDEIRALMKLLEARLTKARWLMICGSLQPGIPPHLYCEMLFMARKRGVRTLLDSDGDALNHALEAKPTAIKPNQQEAERLLGRAIITRSQSLDALERIRAMGPEMVILSLGSRGALAASPEGVFEVVPPRLDVLCPIGSGDALAAAFVWAMNKKKAFYESVRWGVATGTATATLPGISFPAFDRVKEIYKQVQVRPAR